MSDILGNRDENVPERPTRVSEPSRESQLPKRFYDKAECVEDEGRWAVHLDGRPVRTPSRALLSFQRHDIADAVAAEWQSQDTVIDIVTMPLTRLANTAFDGVAADMQAVKEDIVRFVGSDLLCYRADGPSSLVDRESEQWDPLLEWAQSKLGTRLVLAEGIMFVQQPSESINAFSAFVGGFDDPLELAALHVATALTGSAIIAAALAKGRITLDEAWTAAFVDEDYNIEQWGADAEAAAVRRNKLRDMKAAALVLRGADTS